MVIYMTIAMFEGGGQWSFYPKEYFHHALQSLLLFLFTEDIIVLGKPIIIIFNRQNRNLIGK